MNEVYPKSNELIDEDRLRQVKFIAGIMYNRLAHRVDLNDLVSAGNLGLVKAARKADGRPTNTFATYADRRIKFEMLDYVRTLDLASRDERLRGDVQRFQVSTELTLKFVPCRRHDPTQKYEVQQLLDRIKPKLAAVVRMYYLEDVTMQSIGERLHRNQSWIRKMVTEGLVAMRKVGVRRPFS